MQSECNQSKCEISFQTTAASKGKRSKEQHTVFKTAVYIFRVVFETVLKSVALN